MSLGVHRDIKPLSIFREAEVRRKGGRWPTHGNSKKVWDVLDKFSVTFISGDHKHRLRIHASQQHGVCVQEIVQHRYNPTSSLTRVGDVSTHNLKGTWMSWGKVQLLAQNLGMGECLDFLWANQALVQDASFPRMLNCGECRCPVDARRVCVPPPRS